MGATRNMSDLIVSTGFEDIPPKGIEIVKRSILDWIGCVYVGAQRPAARIVSDYLDEEGGAPQARIFATGLRTSSANAALANGVMGHVEDFDDSGNHTASFLTPTVFALGEELHLSGKQVLTAWAIGCDITSTIDEGLRPDRAWHKTAVFGTMGATAAASKLLGLDSHKTCMALGIAASEAGGVMRNFGTMTKAFHPGNAARSAIVAAKLAARGYTAAADIIEARYGYADCFGGEKCYVPAMTQFLGKVSFVTSRGPAIKAWPCCSSNHRPLTGIMNFLQHTRVSAKDIERVEHYGYVAPGTGSLQYKEVNDGLQGKFSMEYNIAAAFIDGKVNLATFSDERSARGDIQAFMKKIHRYQDTEVGLHSNRTKAGQDTGRMRVVLKDGTTHEFELGPRRTLTGEAVIEKFRLNAQSALSRNAVEHVISLVDRFEKITQMGELVDAITVR